MRKKILALALVGFAQFTTQQNSYASETNSTSPQTNVNSGASRSYSPSTRKYIYASALLAVAYLPMAAAYPNIIVGRGGHEYCINGDPVVANPECKWRWWQDVKESGRLLSWWFWQQW